MKILLCMAAFLAALASDWTDAVTIITGTPPEELDEETWDRFSALHDHPIDLNGSPRSRLLSCGLFTEYQVASLLDSRAGSGDILSWTELGLTDGFSPALARALSYFCTLAPTGTPGNAANRSIRQDIMVRTSAKQIGNDEVMYCYGGKYNISFGEMMEVNWASRTTYSEQRFTPGTASVALYGKRHPGKIVAGDFNARYGQGLMQWSGFSLSSYSSVTSMIRRGTGLSASKSFNRTLHGLGADFEFGNWSLDGAWAFPGTGLVHASWNGKNATLGSGVMYKAGKGPSCSTDWRIGKAGFCLYGEAAYSISDGPAMACGLLYAPVYGTETAALFKYGKDGSQGIIGFQNKWLTSTIDATFGKSYKALLQVKPSIDKEQFTITPALRLQARYKLGDSAPLRLEARAECTGTYDRWQASGRYDIVLSKASSWLWYTEAGYRSGLSAFLRFTLFKIDNWADRIWVYERDAPGNFNVPAYYGRGFACSAAASYKLKKHSLHIRASYVGYPWNLTDKESVAEVKLQYQLKL